MKIEQALAAASYREENASKLALTLMFCLEEPRPLHPHLYLHPFHSHHSFSNSIQTYLHTPPLLHTRTYTRPVRFSHVPIAALTVSIYVTLLLHLHLLLHLLLLLLLLLLSLGLDDLRSLDNFSATPDARLSLVVSIHQRFPSISVDSR